MTRHASTRKQLIALIEQGSLPAEKIEEALTLTKIRPSSEAWWAFIDRLLLWTGALALATAVLFFVAYNWHEIGRFAKFGALEALIALAIGVYWKLENDSLGGKLSLLVAAILLGVLLALFGQTYQTGADPWQLFFNWALLILPWALIGRFPTIWILWITLINLSIVLYPQAFQSTLGVLFNTNLTSLWLVFSFNLTALAVWEILSKNHAWLSTHWATRLLSIGSGIPITWLALIAIWSSNSAETLGGLVWAIWLAALYGVYRKLKPDLFMLAGGCLSGIVVIVGFIANHMSDDADGLFLISLLIIGLASGAAAWLRNLQREMSS